MPALLFDLDGVIIDSNPVHLEVWRLYLAGLGMKADDTLPAVMYGRRNDEIVRALFGERLSEEEVARHGKAKEALYREIMRPQLRERLVPGMREFLEECAACPKAVVSNAEPANVHFVLQGAGLAHYFQLVLDGHQVERPKPAPDIYLRAARLLGREPADCVVFEDSEAGIAAARAAGCRVVAVCLRGPAPADADLTIRDFFDPGLKAWVEKQMVRA